MHISRWTIVVLLTVAFATGAALTAVAPGKKQLKQAQKLLAQIKLVDGPGSGLDADTVQGATPSQLKASITPPSPPDVLAAIKSVDGAGSGLDADKLQGLTPAQVAALAPSGGGAGAVRVVDAVGSEVGVVARAHDQSADVFREVGNDLLFFSVTARGFATSSVGFSYTTANCKGTQYFVGVDPDAFGSEVQIDRADGKTGYFARASELTTQQYYSLGQEGCDPCTAQEVIQQCTSSGGVVIGTTFPCRDGGICVDCCAPTTDANGSPAPVPAAPVHTVDVSQFGVQPPFKLQR